MFEKPAVAGGVSGGVAGALFGALATVTVAFVAPLMAGYNFERNLATEVIKGAKSADDVEARLKLLCARRFVESDKHCPAK